MNLWDRLIGAINPERALRSQAARSAMTHVRQLGARSGARSGRRYAEPSTYDADFNVNTGRIEDALPRAKVPIRRIRRLLRTNPYAAKVRQTLLNNLIGFGITGTPVKGTPRKVSDHWNLWVRNADWMRRLDFYGLQDLAVGTMLGDGECFIVRRFDRSAPGVVPLRLEIFDAAMLCPTRDTDGIEYDQFGRPIKYTFHVRRPGTGSLFPGPPVSFDAKDVIHLFRQDFPGQTRGYSVFEPVIKRFEDMDDYIEAEVVRKKIEACFAAFITPSADTEITDFGGQSDDLTRNDFEVEVFEPGMIERLRPGDDIKFGDPKPSAAIGEFARVTLLGATTGAGVPYEHGTGDLSNVNYSSYRAGNLEFQRFCGRLQWLQIIPVALERIWDWFCEDAYQMGMIGKRTYAIGWTPPAFESIDRGKDVKADILEIAAGLNSRRRLVGARGEQFDELIAEIAADLQATEALDLQFQGDPRAGRNAPPTDAADDPAAADDAEEADDDNPAQAAQGGENAADE